MSPSKSTTLAAAFEVEAVGVPKTVSAAVPFPALAILASSQATRQSIAPALDLKSIE